ncbi:hypothetical protein FHS31_001865 [Sphingomonas vulcanisoli]|uniref:Uncharacterized protein n=1 Tax=Sphingomonas vulcanisoli TaxID=1658060 RepID=A0ABX0TRV1_9SPHN|nr:hypothetical protein [Sphingomonas vulcanisoli]NIJ08248.1 hypothetical protein [Sphingomonas vulcanisoli]
MTEAKNCQELMLGLSLRLADLSPSRRVEMAQDHLSSLGVCPRERLRLQPEVLFDGWEIYVSALTIDAAIGEIEPLVSDDIIANLAEQAGLYRSEAGRRFFAGGARLPDDVIIPPNALRGLEPRLHASGI